jgi:hypothetical protein
MNYLAYTTSKAPTIARQNVLFAVIMELVTPREAVRLMKRIEKMPRFTLRLPKREKRVRDV